MYEHLSDAELINFASWINDDLTKALVERLEKHVYPEDALDVDQYLQSNGVPGVVQLLKLFPGNTLDALVDTLRAAKAGRDLFRENT